MTEVNFLVKKGLTVPKGSASTPSVIFDASDSNTGLYSPGADQVAVATNGQGRLFVDASGNVGIANSSPTNARLLVGDDLGAITTAARMVQVGHPSGGMLILGKDNTDYSYFTHEASTQTSNWFYRGGAGITLNSAGLVGIGTSTPGANLEVFGDTADVVITNVTNNNATGANKSLICGVGGATAFSVPPWPNSGFIDSATTNGLALGSSSSTGSVRFYTGTSRDERARIDSSGRLLVGTTSSLLSYSKLQVQGGAGVDPGAHICLSNENSAPSSGSNIGSVRFTNNAGGIGAILGCEADGAWTAGSDYRSRLVFSVTADGASSPTERMRIANTGATDIFSSTANVLGAGSNQAAGTVYYLFYGANNASSTTTGTTCFVVFTNGNVQNTNNSYAGISDAKLKENIVDATSQWSDIKALQVRKYNFKEGQTHTQIGLIAQEVELISPGLVSESPDRDADGNDLGTVTKSVNYSVLYMKAVKALQEAMERIEVLEQRLNDAGIN
jgi:hypothetical protein